MTTNDLPDTEEGAAESPGIAIEPPPPSSPPAASITVPTGAKAGVPATVTLHLDRGTRFVLRNNRWEGVPDITYAETELTIPNVASIRDHRTPPANVHHPITFPSPGTYTVTGAGITTSGARITAPQRTVTVVAPNPPVFTWTAPANGAVVEVGPSGGPVDIQLSTGTDQIYPLTVGITRDGVTTTAQHTGSQYTKTVTLAPTPVGARSISVTCTDPGGRASTQTRSVTTRNSVPPSVGIDPFDNDVTVETLPHILTLTGTTSGTQAGVTGVAYAFTNGPSGTAINTGPGMNWSTWRLTATLPTTGTFAFTVTATNSSGVTGSANSSITLRL